MSTSKITIDQLRNSEIVAADLLPADGIVVGRRRSVITAPSEPLSVFGRKLAGHES